MATGKKATAKKTAPAKTAKPNTKHGPEGTTKRPEADAEASPTYRADMGEGLPPQADALNPDRAK